MRPSEQPRDELRDLLVRGQALALDVATMARTASVSRRAPLLRQAGSVSLRASTGARDGSTRCERLEDHLLPFFERHTLSAITIPEVDRYAPSLSPATATCRYSPVDAGLVADCERRLLRAVVDRYFHARFHGCGVERRQSVAPALRCAAS